MRLIGKTAFITGASTGIGYDLSNRLCRLGVNVIGCARRVEKIEELSKRIEMEGKKYGRLLPVRCDVREEGDIKAAFKKSAEIFRGVDICVNNAGLAHSAPLLTGSTEEWKEMLDVNILGLSVCTREYMSQLKEQKKNDGHIILLNSLSGHRLAKSPPNTYFYAATKFAVTAITEGIRRELREMDSDVRVTGISLGSVKTEFLGKVLRAEDIEESKKLYGDEGMYLEAEDVTSAIIYALSAPHRMQIHDILIRPTYQTY